MGNRHRRALKPLRLLQINVGKRDTSHELALATAFEERVDIVLIQEPYIFSELERRITKRHPTFECFTPIDNWSTQPRVLTYLRKGVGLQAEQLRPVPSTDIAARDLLFLSILSPSSSNILIINIYNAPPGSVNEQAAINTLLQLPTSSFIRSTFLAGDFNLHHTYWQPSFRYSTAAAEPFVSWIDNLSLSLTSKVDTPTHIQGNVLDLAFASSTLLAQGIETSVAAHLDITSDHYPLLTEIRWDQRFQEHQAKLKPDTLQLERFKTLLQQNLQTSWALPNDLQPKTLDVAALNLVTAIRNAYQGSAARSSGKGMGVPWWNQDCSTAVRTYRTSDRSQEDKRVLRRVVCKAKRQYFLNKFNIASTAKEVFDMSKWHKTAGSYRSPPLKDPTNYERPLAVTLSEKREVLARNLLQNTAEVGDIPFDSPAVPRRSLPFPAITVQEVRNSILAAGNTAPGKDEITTAVLKAGWPLLEEPVFVLFQKCLAASYHPACFRTAILAMLSKPNKPDKSSPRAYRPIALLSVLGKGLERLIARRMSWISTQYQVLPKQQFGALPLRSAVDLTTCLTHDIETALNRGLTASLLTLDVKGAFDAVLPGRLVRRLREQGWPDFLVRWIASFATNRSVYIRLDGSLGPPIAIHCGLPQGSPVSPILFMLYISPLLLLGKPKLRFGYADDVALLQISPSLEENATALSQDLCEALDWGMAEGITFDADKSELIHFSRRQRDKLNSPPIAAGSFTISENMSMPYIRWLGVLFDRKLTFKYHVKTQAAKAVKVSKALSSLGNTVRGVPPKLLRQATVACVLPVAYYAAETWWPGRTRPGPKRPITNRVDGLICALTRVVLTAARAILPVYCTTPTAVLLRESGLPPPEIALNTQVLAATVRLRRLDPLHPLYSRATAVLRSSYPTSRFARRVLALPPSEQVNPLVLAPWSILDRDDASIRIGAPCGLSKEQCTKDFLTFLQNLSPSDIVLYSDGSKLSNGSTGAGFVAYQYGLQILRQAIPLGTRIEVFDAEARAALAGLEAVLTLTSIRFAANLWICLDNLEVALQLLSPSKGSSQEIFQRFAELAPQWLQRQRLPHVHPGKVCIRWVPGHAKVPGNEAADAAAKEGAAMPLAKEPPHSLASLVRWVKDSTPVALTKLWQTVAPQQYRDLGIQTAPLKPKELSLPRATLGRILASRSCHGDFAAYHERFNHYNAYLYCRCGARKAPLHFFFCSIAKRRLHRPPGPPTLVLDFLLGTSAGANTLAAWLRKTRFYEDICPRTPQAVA